MPISASYSSALRRLTVTGDPNAINGITVSRDVGGNILVNGGAIPITGGPATTANTDLIVATGGSANDTIVLDETNGALPAASFSGGLGNDTLIGGSAADTLSGNDGNDILDGRGGTDQLFGGANDDTLTGGIGNDIVNGEDGNDQMIWNPGDGNDLMEGGNGTDLLTFNGNGSNEIFTLQPNGTRVRLLRDVGAITMDLNGLENFTINAGFGTDTVNVSDLTGTGASQVTINLAGTIGSSTADAQLDQVTLTGAATGETIDLLGITGTVSVLGMSVFTVLNQLDATDRLTINGGGGNDTINASQLSSGIVVLTIDGGTGDDNIQGTAGSDTLLGNDGNDIVDGNQGLDTAFLGAGNDVFVWNPGDASDVIEGQTGTDELQFNGSNANEVVSILPNGARFSFQRDVAAINMDMDDVETIRFRALGGTDNITIADMTGTDVTQIFIDLAAAAGGGDTLADRVTVHGTLAADTITVNAALVVNGLFAVTDLDNAEAGDTLIIQANAGDDVIDASAVAAGLITLELQGGLGADVFFGSAGVDLITGGDGNDTALMGAGNDVFTWNPGDDNDVVEGQASIDRLDFNGNGSAEGFTFSPNGGRVILFRDVGAVTMDMNDVEQVTLNAGAGTDNIVINDLTGTDVDTIILNLAGTIGGATADGVLDQITVFGDSGGENIDLLGITGSVSVLGAPAFISINQLDATDRLIVNGGGGNDTINASQLSSGIVVLTIDGGLGNDNIQGTAGSDTLLGGDGDDIVDGNQGLDTAFLGPGNDRFNWNPGDASDIVEGQAGTDELFFNGSNANEVVSISANGARVSFQRDVAAINMDMDDVEKITFNAIGGTDNITVNNLTGTDVTLVVIDLAANGGAADGLADTITVNCTALADALRITSTAPGVITVTGLAWTVEIRNFDGLDRLIVNAGDGNDVVNALGSGIAVQLDGGGGDDQITGGNRDDILSGGLGTDTFVHSPGNDFFDGGDGLLIIA